MTKLAKVHYLGVKLPAKFSVVYTILDDLYSLLFKSYVAFLGRRKVNILLDDWKDVAVEEKNNIWTDI